MHSLTGGGGLRLSLTLRWMRRITGKKRNKQVPKNQEDVREDEVRRRIKEFLNAQGIDQGRVALEILYLLPTEFCRMYVELYDMCFSSHLSTGAGRGGDEGRVKASGSSPPRDPMNARTIRSAQGSSKRYKEPATPFLSDLALDEKRKLDRRLTKAVSDAIGAARRAGSDRTSGSVETTATSGKDKGRQGGARLRPRCPQCGRGQASGWERCPYHGDSVE